MSGTTRVGLAIAGAGAHGLLSEGRVEGGVERDREAGGVEGSASGGRGNEGGGTAEC